MVPYDFWGNRVARGGRSSLLLNHLDPDVWLAQSVMLCSLNYEIEGAKVYGAFGWFSLRIRSKKCGGMFFSLDNYLLMCDPLLTSSLWADNHS